MAFSYHMLRLVGLGLARLSPRSIERGAMVLAVVFFDLLRLRRRTILKNLKIAFPQGHSPQQLRDRGRRSVYHFVLNIAEFLRSVAIDITSDITVIGQEHIDQALAKGQGAYVLCFHMGNWEAMGAKFTKAIRPAHVLVKKVGRGGVAQFVDGVRESNQFLTIKRRKKGDGIHAIREVLQQNEVVGFVIDQARPGEPYLPFFSKPAKTNTSMAAIWAKHPAPIVPSYIVRKSLGSHELHILPELKLETTNDSKADNLNHSIIFNRVVEDVILQQPDQYFWMHNRWK